MGTAQQRKLWIGMVEVRAASLPNRVLGEGKGAFVNVVTWSGSTEEFRRRAHSVLCKLGLVIADVENPEPLETRAQRQGPHFDHEIEDAIMRCRDNPDAIIYCTFDVYENDDA